MQRGLFSIANSFPFQGWRRRKNITRGDLDLSIKRGTTDHAPCTMVHTPTMLLTTSLRVRVPIKYRAQSRYKYIYIYYTHCSMDSASVLTHSLLRTGIHRTGVTNTRTLFMALPRFSLRVHTASGHESQLHLGICRKGIMALRPWSVDAGRGVGTSSGAQ